MTDKETIQHLKNALQPATAMVLMSKGPALLGQVVQLIESIDERITRNEHEINRIKEILYGDTP